MRSQLTRNVFRRLLSGKCLVIHCKLNANSFECCRNQYNKFSVNQLSSRRTFFGFSKDVARKPRDPSITPGLPKMMELSHMYKIGAQPPSAAELKQSWHDFFKDKMKNKEPVNSLQAEHAWRTFEHLKLDSIAQPDKLSVVEIRDASRTLNLLPKDDTSYHKRLAMALYNELREKETEQFRKVHNLECILENLSVTGGSAEAMILLLSFISENSEISVSTDPSQVTCDTNKLWIWILRGFSREKNEAELLRSYKIATENGLVYVPVVQEVMITFFAEKNDIEATKYWYYMPITGRVDSSPNASRKTLAALLQFCLRNGESEWCKSVFNQAISLSPSKDIWDMVFIWTAGKMGKGVEDVDRMIQIMISRNPNNEAMRPNIDTINGLVRLAISKNDPYLAERYLSLGLKFGIKPNGRTFVLQMNYRIDAKDLRGAHAAYEVLQSEEVPDDEDIPAINKYIRALCSIEKPDYDSIRSLLTDLDERGKRLEASTVAALCLKYLNLGEIEDLVDILQANIYHYNLSERSLISATFVQFICDRNNPTIKSWDAYNILRQFFNETNIEQRTQIINSFFDRRRCDMACHAFGHMRQNMIPDRKPVVDTYVACLEGIAKLSDHEYLEVIHNMLKLDSTIEPNTKLYNALMLAYTSVCEGSRALSFWNDITNLYEGPSYKSLEIVFWACQETNFGSEEARKIWGKIKKMKVEVTGPVFAEYLGSLSKDAHWEEVKTLVSKMEQEYGLKPDIRTLGTIYNCLPGEVTKAMMHSWSLEHYPEVWAGVQKFGRRYVRHKKYPEIRTNQYKLNRDFKAS